ncbi:hypothetical protein [Paenibacillus odorifer]|uniref:hypothetical protein n=1 Tax=Paenibacillus odorifer TaxID=189426 RepID=UPI0013A6DCE5|nr:hypothetical protein [Paenibacillus odorifer]
MAQVTKKYSINPVESRKVAQVAKKNGINPAEVVELAQVAKKNGINPVECGVDAYVAKKKGKKALHLYRQQWIYKSLYLRHSYSGVILSLLVRISYTAQFPVLQRWCACDFDPMAHSNGPRIPSHQLPCRTRKNLFYLKALPQYLLLFSNPFIQFTRTI